MTIRIIESDDPLRDPAVLALRDVLRGGALTSAGEATLDVADIVRDIIAEVASGGDEAVARLTSKLDAAEVTPQTLRVEAEAIEAAHQQADGAFLDLVRRVANNIREYQEHIRWSDPPALERGGRRLGVRYTPVDRAALYVPGGRAIYPSTVLMTLVPAQVAGVKEIAIVTPPSCDGDVNPMVLALAAEFGVAEVYRAGGAVGIAAVALGTETIAAVDKVVGPGNAFVAEAKRQLMGRVGIDSIAGPSEVLIVADDTARPQWVAIDLIAQAEHDPGSAVLVTPSRELADAVDAALEGHLAKLSRAEAARAALAAYSGAIVVGDLETACDVASDFATEHLQIVTADDEMCLARIRHAGAIFVGAHTPVPLGDYYAGPSHVLPTGGTARFFGPLSCNDFLKASSVLQYDAESLAEDADDVTDFATREGLTAHAEAVRQRRQG